MSIFQSTDRDCKYCEKYYKSKKNKEFCEITPRGLYQPPDYEELPEERTCSEWYSDLNRWELYSLKICYCSNCGNLFHIPDALAKIILDSTSDQEPKDLKCLDCLEKASLRTVELEKSLLINKELDLQHRLYCLILLLAKFEKKDTEEYQNVMLFYWNLPPDQLVQPRLGEMIIEKEREETLEETLTNSKCAKCGSHLMIKEVRGYDQMDLQNRKTGHPYSKRLCEACQTERE